MAELQEYEPVTTSITTPDVQVASQSIEFKLGSLASQMVSIKEAKQIVAAEGACRALDFISINPASLRDNQKIHFKPEELRILSPVIDRGEAKSSELKPYLDEVLNNEFLLDQFTAGSLSREVLQQHFKVAQPPQINRMFFILNYNIDPELIPFTFAGMALRQRDIPEVFINHLSNSEYGRQKLAILLSNPVYMDNLAGLKSDDRQQYPPDLLGDIYSFMNNCLLEISHNPKVTKEQTLSLREYLLKFFNVGREGWYGTESVRSFFSALTDVTKSTYFESYKDSVGGKKKSPLTGAVTVKDLIPQYRKSTEVAKYLATLYHRVKNIYAGAFPQIYNEPDIESLIITEPNERTPGAWRSSLGEIVRDANGSYSHIRKSIEITSGTVIRKGGVEEFKEETNRFPQKPTVKRKVGDSITMAHELTHAIYEKFTGSGVLTTLGNFGSVNYAIDEGFAVMMELLFIDVLKANPGLMDLSVQDIADLESEKRNRLFSLKKGKNAYTEGTFRILHKVYSEAAGKGGKRDMNAGLAAIRQFVTALNPDRILHISRMNKEYRDFLKKGDPTEWTRLFSQPQESVA